MREKIMQVLWIENDPIITTAYPGEAEMVAGIELCPYECWEDAEAELENNYDRWDAIILDAKCKYRKGDADKADRFLSNVFPKLMVLAARKNRTIPWYVLSGQGEDDIRDLIPETNEWDEDWIRIANRRFYSKNGIVKLGRKDIQERQVLFKRIKDQVTLYRHEIQVEYNLYPDVFSALDRLDLAGEVGYYLMPLLEPIHFEGTSNANYNRRYADLRKSLEHIFRHMAKMGILPSIIIGNGKKKEVNLSWSSLFLGSNQPMDLSIISDSEKKFWKNVKRNIENPILPKQLGNWLKDAVFQAGAAVHTSTGEKEIAMNLDNYLPHVGNSPYMLRSLAMGLCDFILWYDNFVKENPDEEVNAVKFWTLTNSKF